jgi:hypothetical protein
MRVHRPVLLPVHARGADFARHLDFMDPIKVRIDLEMAALLQLPGEEAS